MYSLSVLDTIVHSLSVTDLILFKMPLFSWVFLLYAVALDNPLTSDGSECALVVTGAYDRRLRLWDVLPARASCRGRAQMLGTLSSKVSPFGLPVGEEKASCPTLILEFIVIQILAFVACRVKRLAKASLS